MSGQRYRAREGVVLSGEGDARFLTDLGTGEVFELNATAVRIFQEAAQGSEVARVVEALEVAYPDVPRDELERDAREMLDHLVREGLLQALPP